MAKLYLFPQIARKIPREIVNAAVEKYKSNKGCQYLDVLTHLLPFLLCHLGDCQFLRDVCHAMKCFLPNLKELGIEKTPSRNALSHQNARQNPNVFREIYMRLVKHLGQQPLGRDEVSGIRSSRVVLLDSSVVTLCLSLFQWASYKEEKGAIKMHTLFSVRDFLPVDIYVSDGKKSDNEGAYQLTSNKRHIIVADRGYDERAILALKLLPIQRKERAIVRPSTRGIKAQKRGAFRCCRWHNANTLFIYVYVYKQHY